MAPSIDGVIVRHEHGARPPIVFFHTWDTEAAQLEAMATLLGPDQPLYGIEPPPDEADLPESVDAWVRYHRAHLAALPVSSPYWLAGYSFGGVIALEIARQLRAEGAEVAWLGLVDTLRPKRNPPAGKGYLAYHLQEVLDLRDPVKQRAYVGRRLRRGVERMPGKVKRMGGRFLRRVGLRHERPPKPPSLPPRMRSIWISYLGYTPDPYDAPVALFTGRGNLEMAAGDPSLLWSRYLRGGFEVTPLVGAHEELFEGDNAPVNVAAMRTSLERARAAQTG